MDALQRRTPKADQLSENTTLVCLATNAELDSRGARRLTIFAHDAIARTILPAHTLGDGDVAFAIGTGTTPLEPEDSLTLGLMAVRAVERAILNSVLFAEGRYGIPSALQWHRESRL